MPRTRATGAGDDRLAILSDVVELQLADTPDRRGRLCVRALLGNCHVRGQQGSSPLRTLGDALLNPIHDAIKPFSGQEVGEDKG